MHLDKDILVKGNKIYSPNTCVFVNRTINNLFTKSNDIRGELPIGVNKTLNNKYISQISLYNFEDKKKHKITLGRFKTVIEAFNIYKQAKEDNIKRVADYYKDKIPQKLYNAMHNWKIEITD